MLRLVARRQQADDDKLLRLVAKRRRADDDTLLRLVARRRAEDRLHHCPVAKRWRWAEERLHHQIVARQRAAEHHGASHGVYQDKHVCAAVPDPRVGAGRRHVRTNLLPGGDHGGAVERVADVGQHVLGESPVHALGVAQRARRAPAQGGVSFATVSTILVPHGPRTGKCRRMTTLTSAVRAGSGSFSPCRPPPPRRGEEDGESPVKKVTI
jgi:hypothetical protein